MRGEVSMKNSIGSFLIVEAIFPGGPRHALALPGAEAKGCVLIPGCADRCRWERLLLPLALCLALALAPLKAATAADAGPPGAVAGEPAGTTVLSVDGEGWLLATDPENRGVQDQWFRAPRPEARRTRVPWIIQGPFPGYHGLAWYWRSFTAPAALPRDGRFLLRFWAVDYKADVWIDGASAGSHEGGETPFVLDVTRSVRPGGTHMVAVRVLNPTHQSIDGIVLDETPHRNKALPYGAGSAWDQGGIVDSVELLAVPAVRIEDLFVRGDPRTGEFRIQVDLQNSSAARGGRLEFTVAPAPGGETFARSHVEKEIPAGGSRAEARLVVGGPRLWDLNDPYLYRVTVRVSCEDPPSRDERSVRAGLRDFRFRDGAFRLNGRRLFLRSSHTGNACPVGLELPLDPDFLRRDLLNAKTMGFNAIRFIAGMPKRYQLDLCDEIGLLVYEECYAGWCMADSPSLPRRFRDSVLGMVLRDRNHPSVAMWGLLNETPDGPVFRQAVSTLPALRELDDSRLVMLSSGRWDLQGGRVVGLEVWSDPGRVDPCVVRNGTDHVIRALGITWAPGQLSLHPGRAGEYSALRFTAPETGSMEVSAAFASIAEHATTDVHVLLGDRAVFDGGINVRGGGKDAAFRGALAMKAGDTLTCAVGFGNGDYGADTTALALTIRAPSGKSLDAAREFSVERNPSGPFSYGTLAPGPEPRPSTFKPHAGGKRESSIGSLSNPGSEVWEDALSDQHPYQRVPHTAAIIHTLRTVDGGGQPLFLSEYGIGSAVDLVRAVRHYERLGKQEAEDARFYRAQLDLFLADWDRFRLGEVFARPEDFFALSNARMAGQRLLGLNAIRSNPHIVGHSLTGTVDQGMTGEGLWTTFREPKPGTSDAVFDGLAPLRFCLFVEPVNVYRSSKVRLEAVLASEDPLPPGRYPVRIVVAGPGPVRVLERSLEVAIPERQGTGEPPMVIPVFLEEAAIDGPSGKYRFLASFERGAAAAGGEAEFHVADPSELPPVETPVTLWGEDRELARWLEEHKIRTRAFTGEAPPGREVILAAGAPPAPGGAAAFAELARRIACGSTAVFLSPGVFGKGGEPAGWMPLKKKGTIAGLPSWLYHKEEWAKVHPIFDGLPAGDLLDYTFYREIIPDLALVGQDPPGEAVAGAINAAQGYSSGLLVAVHELGAGRFILNTLLIRENLGAHPAAERLMRNLLRYAARDAGKPAAALPDGFEKVLEGLGYK
jgi:glycosyl hydrolase family 2